MIFRKLLGAACWLGCALSLAVVSPPGGASTSLSFLSLPFERLDPRELAGLHAARLVAPESTTRDHDLALIEYFLAERALAEGRPHAALRLTESVGARCEKVLGSEPRPDELVLGRASALCAVAEADRLGRVSPAVAVVSSGLLRSYLQGFETARWDPVERFWIEARIYAFLPPHAGRDVKRSLVALSALERLRPELSSTEHWQGRVHRLQRNEPVAREAFARALARSPQDERTRLLDASGALASTRTEVDGWRHGLSSSVFLNAALGLGASIGWQDERFGDRDRSVEARAWASSRGRVGAAGRMADRQWSGGGIELYGALRAETGPEDFFGLAGVNARPRMLSVGRVDGEAGARVALGGGVYVEGGLAVASRSVRESGAAAVLPAGYSASDSLDYGPYLEAGIDGRDSRYVPWRGTSAAARIYFPVGGDARDFQLATLSAESHLPLGFRHSLALSAGVAGGLGTPPFGRLPRLGGTLSFPGVREGRFVDRFVAGASAEYRRKVSAAWLLGTYATVLTASDDASRLAAGPWKPGAGLVAHLSLAPTSRPFVRIEAGRLGPDWVLQARAGMSL